MCINYSILYLGTELKIVKKLYIYIDEHTYIYN